MSKKINTETEEQNSQNEQIALTPEQMTQMRQRMLEFYTEEIPYLELQEKYERLQADIEEHKVRRMTMMIRGAQMYAAGEAAEREAAQKENVQEEQNTTSSTSTNSKRSLKSD